MSEIRVEAKMIGEGETTKLTLPRGSDVSHLLKKLNKNPEEVVVKVNDRIVPEDMEVREGDLIETIPVVSGG
ncbi:MAG: MoaD/ThiS family protein [Candidatus Hadarchaeota archaeon]